MGKNLIIIGNGFDLHCDLKSKFSDFFSYSYDNNPIYKNLSTKITYNTAWYGARGIYTAYIEAITKFDENITIFDLMFILVNEDKKIEYWNDFEETLKDSLLDGKKFSWSKVLSLINTARTSGNSAFGEPITYEKIVAKVLYSILTSNPNRGIFNEVKENEFYNFLLKQLKSFEQRFLKYLDGRLINNYEYYFNSQNCIKLVCDKPDDYENTKILSFNYTNFSIQDGTKYNIFNLHGNLSHNDCIIGIDDPSDKELIRPFTKSDRKSYLDEYPDQSFDFDYKNVTNVYLYGHSFNKMDNRMYFTIFDCLKLKERPLSIRFHICYSNSDKNKGDDPNIATDLKRKFNSLLRDYFKNDLSLFDEVASGRHISAKFIP